MLNSVQKKLINMLLDKYERSKSFTGENVHNQTFSIKPDRLYSPYYSDYADVDELREFGASLDALEKAGFIRLKKKQGVLLSVSAVNEKLSSYYALVNRLPSDKLLENRIMHYKKLKGRCPVLNRFCDDEIKKLSSGLCSLASDSELEELSALICRVSENKEELLERELSILVLGDSKSFEKNYRHKLCRILSAFGEHESSETDFPEDFYYEGNPAEEGAVLFSENGCETAEASETEDISVRQRETEILDRYMIVPNPSYVFFKGKGYIEFASGQKLSLSPAVPMALSSSSIKNIERIEICVNRLVSIENLTAFNRFEDENSFILYLAGYPGRAKQLLLKKIAGNTENSALEYFHAGDIDPDGFCILETLKKKTGIAFKPLYMGISELTQYPKSLKVLTAADIKKAGSLIAKGLYTEVLGYMLKNGCKLEQEIVILNNYLSTERLPYVKGTVSTAD